MAMEEKQRLFWEALVLKDLAETELRTVAMLRGFAEQDVFQEADGPTALRAVARIMEEMAKEVLATAPDGSLTAALGELIAMRDNCRCKS